MFWGLETTRFAGMIMDSHVIVYPRSLLYAGQTFATSLLVLVLILFLDGLGQRIANRGSMTPVSVSWTTVVIVITVTLDWVAAQLAWWTILTQRIQASVVPS